MTMTNQLPRRERLLALWAKGRLGERSTVEWAVNDVNRIRGEIGKEAVALFELLDSQASTGDGLSLEVKKLWHLFATVARERAREQLTRNGSLVVYQFKQKLAKRSITEDDVDELVECYRPLLSVGSLSPLTKETTQDRNEPMEWVHWSFSSSASFGRTGERISVDDLRWLNALHLTRLLERSTDALSNAMRLASDVGWLSAERDLPNLYVHRVSIGREVESSTSDSENGRDPDRHNSSFAPIVRLMGSGFDALVPSDAAAALRIAQHWRGLPGGLFLRLFAHAAAKPSLIPSEEVGDFLISANEQVFWRWMVFPEAATLRVARWEDITNAGRAAISERLLRGPSQSAFPGDSGTMKAIRFHRDHELARLVDAGVSVPADFIRFVQERRERDPKFPKHVPAVEPGLPGAEARWVAPGTPAAFDAVSSTQLIHSLWQSHRGRQFGVGSDAEAFGRTLFGKQRILDSFNAQGLAQEEVDFAWELLLSYAHEKSSDLESERTLCERIISVTVNMPAVSFGRIFDRLCDWLNSSDEKLSELSGGDQLWLKLLPYSATRANEGSSEKSEIDLTIAALNEPLGHLISYFLRRCPTQEPGAPKPLPAYFVNPLKQLSGRAKEILANRMTVLLNYFWIADREWMTEAVTSKMSGDTDEANRLWEAFGQYGQFPTPALWQLLEKLTLNRILSTSLSPEAKRQLIEMAVVAWIRSKLYPKDWVADASSLRNTLGLSSDDIRSAAAWRFLSVFDDNRARHDIEEDEQESAVETSGESNGNFIPDLWPKIGVPFFIEVWPIEPTLQSSNTAKQFARIPARSGLRFFGHAVNRTLPYLRPFQVWSLQLEFSLGQNRYARRMIRTYPEELLALLNACISDNQMHGIIGLNDALNQIVGAREQLGRDHRFRRLRRLVRT
jgi:hypothetical protein